MKKNRIILYAALVIIAGVLTGVTVSGLIWEEHNIPGLPDFFAGEKDKDTYSEEQPSKNSRGRGNGIKAEYKITKGQSYYQALTDKGDRNVLLIGEDASSGNFDTIIIASVSDKNKKIRLFNFPRDIYIDYSDEVLSRLKEKSPKLFNAKGFQKINAAHTVGNRIQYEEGKGDFGDSDMDFLVDLIEEIFQISIDDYAYVNTKGFREIVDLFGGVDIEVPLRMKYDDPVQNLHIDLQPGMQHLNGERAEWFVRFRQGYDDKGVFKSYSDQFRKENQNKFLTAFFKQNITLKNLGKVDEISKLMGKNIRTSIGGIKTIASYVNMMRKALTGQYAQESTVIECPNTKRIDGVYFEIIRSE